MGIYLSLIILGNAFFSDHCHVFDICLSKLRKVFKFLSFILFDTVLIPLFAASKVFKKLFRGSKME